MPYLPRHTIKFYYINTETNNNHSVSEIEDFDINNVTTDDLNNINNIAGKQVKDFFGNVVGMIESIDIHGIGDSDIEIFLYGRPMEPNWASSGNYTAASGTNWNLQSNPLEDIERVATYMRENTGIHSMPMEDDYISRMYELYRRGFNDSMNMRNSYKENKSNNDKIDPDDIPFDPEKVPY